MSAFCVETQERTLVFAALKDDCVDWVEKLCNSTFQVRGNRNYMNHVHCSTLKVDWQRCTDLRSVFVSLTWLMLIMEG